MSSSVGIIVPNRWNNKHVPNQVMYINVPIFYGHNGFNLIQKMLGLVLSTKYMAGCFYVKNPDSVSLLSWVAGFSETLASPGKPTLPAKGELS